MKNREECLPAQIYTKYGKVKYTHKCSGIRLLKRVVALTKRASRSKDRSYSAVSRYCVRYSQVELLDCAAHKQNSMIRTNYLGVIHNIQD